MSRVAVGCLIVGVCLSLLIGILCYLIVVIVARLVT